ncbi:MAG: hypothetical protein U1E06_08840 [Tabrizicola sp.]|nr:hypothetical protein [Tabrizicola sp.]
MGFARDVPSFGLAGLTFELALLFLIQPSRVTTATRTASSLTHSITQRNRPFHLVAVLRQLQVIDHRGCRIIRHRRKGTGISPGQLVESLTPPRLFIGLRIGLPPSGTGEIGKHLVVAPGLFHGVQQPEPRIASGYQILARLFCPRRNQPLDIGSIEGVEGARGVILDGRFDLLEQVLVVNDIAVILVLPVQTVHPADSLEQPMVAHLLVDVDGGGRRRVEAGQ